MTEKESLDIDSLFEDFVADKEVVTDPELPVELKPVLPPKKYGKDLSKLFKDALTTRSVKPQQSVPVVNDEIKERTHIEKLFSPQLVPASQSFQPTPIISTPRALESKPVFASPGVEPVVTRRTPLPRVVMTHSNQTFIQKLKSIFSFSRVGKKISSKKREIKTGLTARQRIKRYNSIHEGGYGLPASTIDGDDFNV